MCGICGVVLAKNHSLNEEQFINMVKQTIKRGRDSLGIVICTHDNKWLKLAIDIENELEESLKKIPKSPQAIFAVCRAEPTTEVVENKIDQLPPFISNDQSFVVAHNGVVSNDHKLRQKYHSPSSKIDSAIIPEVFASTNDHLQALDELMGSFALAIYNTHQQQLILYRDYQPLWYSNDKDNIYFASEQQALPFSSAKELQPYSGKIYSQGQIRSSFTIDKRPESNKVYVIHSGGLDSTVVLADAMCEEDKVVTAIYMNYSPRVNDREYQAAKYTAEKLASSFKKLDIPWLSQLGGSPLTDLTMEIAEEEKGAETASEWVPARNTLFISIVAAMCDVENVYDIRLGLNLEEAGAYSDNTVEFFKKMEAALALGTMARPKIYCPLAYLTKKEIVAKALKIKAPIELSYSCYSGRENHCGKCGPCYMRKIAFKLNKVIDPVEYEELPENFWDGCDKI